MKKFKLLYILNDPHPLKYFLKNHISYLNQKKQFDVTIIFNNEKNENFDEFGVKILHFPMHRRPNITKDLYCLLRLIIHLLINRYDIIHSISPKSGLLSSISSFLTFHGIRLHTFTGQVWANYVGIKLYLFKTLDKLIIKLNTICLIDSFAQKNFLLENNIGNENLLCVLNNGSICGVDMTRFNIIKFKKEELRTEFNIKRNDYVILFLGRLNFDKGVVDLYNAFKKLDDSNTHLFLVGNDEENIIDYIQNDSSNLNIQFISETKNPEKYIALSDVLCLPSYREGFGNVVIESASMKVPSVVSNIYGLKDSIIDGETGLYFELGNVDMLYAKLNYLYKNKEIRLDLGNQAFEFVKLKFNSNDLSKSLYEFYRALLK